MSDFETILKEVSLVFRTIVHQTLEDRDNADYVESHGPFQAEKLPLYLGNGYYFWDDHLELAHWWGKVHCRSRYMICDGELNVRKDCFLDLVGCRQDLKYMKDVITRLGIGSLKLGQIIELLKDINGRPKSVGSFPYKVIRAVDNSSSSYMREIIEFVGGREGYTSLNPIFIICLIEKNPLYLQKYRVIYPESYRLD